MQAHAKKIVEQKHREDENAKQALEPGERSDSESRFSRIEEQRVKKMNLNSYNSKSIGMQVLSQSFVGASGFDQKSSLGCDSSIIGVKVLPADQNQ